MKLNDAIMQRASISAAIIQCSAWHIESRGIPLFYYWKFLPFLQPLSARIHPSAHLPTQLQAGPSTIKLLLLLVDLISFLLTRGSLSSSIFCCCFYGPTLTAPSMSGTDQPTFAQANYFYAFLVFVHCMLKFSSFSQLFFLK